MRLIFIGDTHGMTDLNKLKLALPEMGLFSDDVLIHCGDMGSFAGSKAEEFWRALPCRVVLCAGNHEDYGHMRGLEDCECYGARGKMTAANIFVPNRGEFLDIFGKRFFMYSGAYSVDYMYRRADISIFHEELAYVEEAEEIRARLKNIGQVDYIISHDGPLSITSRIMGFKLSARLPEGYYRTLGISGQKLHAGLFLEELLNSRLSYENWFFGHHHRDVQLGKLRCLFNDIVIHDLSTGKTTEIKQAKTNST